MIWSLATASLGLAATIAAGWQPGPRSGLITAGAREWLAGPERKELGLLPFGMDEALLPGETKVVHLFEARFLTLFSDAAAKHHGCLGQLLVTRGGHAAAVSPLLVVEESRRGVNPNP